MREIKFRAWDKRTKGMFPNDYLVEAGRQLVIFAQRMRPELPDMENAKGGLMLFTDDKNMEFMQFTGLRDKNGKEIYTGDIIQQFDDRCVVEDCPGGWHLGMIRGGNAGSTFVVSFLGEYCEVIGNIHENPELLGGE